MAAEEATVSAVSVSQTIEEKPSAKKGRTAPKRLLMRRSTGRGSTRFTPSIGPRLVRVSEGVSPKGRAMGSLTSFASKAEPSRRRMPAWSAKV